VEESLTGRLLISSPDLSDPNFDRTVVLMLAHSEEGALGVVLSRPSAVRVDEHLPGWSAVAAAPAVVHVGGPVQPTAVLALGVHADAGPPSSGFEPVIGRIGVLDLALDADAIVGRLAGLRVFAGYAGWGDGQLEGEMAVGAWFDVPARDDDVLAPSPAALWRSTLRRQGGRLAWVANRPEDPAAN
jgi:putative transcriptional regulator